jgi:ERCC4-related helicase
MYHQQPPGVAKAMEAKGLKYCPMREAWVEPPTQTNTSQSPTTGATHQVAPQPAAQSLTMPAVQKPWQLLSMISPDCPAPRHYQETFLSTFYSNPDKSFLLQAPTGSGKTFTALYAAGMHLERGERVVFVVPTIDLMNQTYAEAVRLFGDRPDIIRKLSGKNKKARDAAYHDPAAKLLIIVGPSCASDIKQGKLDPTSIGLLLLDEADLMRGEEPVAQIIRGRKALTNPPRTILMSATLTIADEGTPQYRQEITALKIKTGIPDFFQLYPDAKQQSTYRIHRETVRLNDDICAAAEGLHHDFIRRFDAIQDAIPSLPFSAERDRIDNLTLRMRSEISAGTSLILPKVFSVQGLVESLQSLEQSLKEEIDTSKHSQSPESPTASRMSGRDLSEALSAVKSVLKIAYELRFLRHAHQLLVTSLRINFLEYTSAEFFRYRSPGMEWMSTAPGSEPGIFTNGGLPRWWTSIAAGTPYELIARVSRSSAAPLEAFLKKHGCVAAGHTEVARRFFCDDQHLGVAAKALATAQTSSDHPKVDSLLAWIKGPLRRNDCGQLLVTCWTALDAKFLAAHLAHVTGEKTVALVGQSHTNDKARPKDFELAKSGEASIVCGTSVVARGVDLQKLHYLIMLDPTSDLTLAKQYFGRVGRGERVVGSVIILVTAGGPDQQREFKRVGKAVKAGVTFQEPPARGKKRRPPGAEPTLWSPKA